MAELVYQTWERITGKPWSAARAGGYTTGGYNENLALQQRLLGGWNPYQAATPAPAPTAQPATAPAAAPAQAPLQQTAEQLSQEQKATMAGYIQPVTGAYSE